MTRCAGGRRRRAAARRRLECAAYAQRTTGEIAGKVVDGSGGTLPGVTVTLQRRWYSGAPSGEPPEVGAYPLSGVAGGALHARVRTRRIRHGRHEAQRLGRTDDRPQRHREGGRARRDADRQCVAPVVNVDVGSQHELQPRWVPERASAPLLLLDLDHPAGTGVARPRTSVRSTSAQVLGNSTNENQCQIDGTDISSTPWPNTDAIEEVQVTLDGCASAELTATCRARSSTSSRGRAPMPSTAT